ncbi:MAG: hypothetical protein H5T45_07145 [Thermoplasmatales archaeon]|nr:hypothetical protein [Thermoplasmatales archaeon]
MEKKDKLFIKSLITFVASIPITIIIPLFIEKIATGPTLTIIIAPIVEEFSKLIPLFLALFFYPYKKDIPLKCKMLYNIVFVSLSSFTGIIFGLWEFLNGLSAWNILGHFSTTTINSILLVTWLGKVKYPYKYLGISLVGLGILLHSITNQYANIGLIDTHDSYLVGIAKFLKEKTPLINQLCYIKTIFSVATLSYIIYIGYHLRKYFQYRKA